MVSIGFWKLLPVYGLVWWLWQLPTLVFEGHHLIYFSGIARSCWPLLWSGFSDAAHPHSLEDATKAVQGGSDHAGLLGPAWKKTRDPKGPIWFTQAVEAIKLSHIWCYPVKLKKNEWGMGRHTNTHPWFQVDFDANMIVSSSKSRVGSNGFQATNSKRIDMLSPQKMKCSYPHVDTKLTWFPDQSAGWRWNGDEMAMHDRGSSWWKALEHMHSPSETSLTWKEPLARHMFARLCSPL